MSNHGGRQLDAVASSVSKLPAVVDAIGDAAEVYVDGGIRSGIDVVRAVALGARGVLMGRPWLYALAANGEAGIRDLLKVFHREIAVALALTGVNSVHELSRELIDSDR